ncbi:MAG: histidine--tRNA ligase [Thermoplasmatota archaeon]
MVEFQRPRGTRDFGPEEMKVRRKAEEIMRGAIASFGYEEVSTPTFEHAELFIARSGPQIIDQIYDFRDKGGRDLVLRPELTAPVMRMYNSELKKRSKPIRIFYFGNCFRYERPQKGRFREFWQMGLEYIGTRSPAANAEVINAAISSLRNLGLRDFVVRIGHVAILSSILSSWGLQREVNSSLYTAIDKKDKEGIRELLEGTDEAERLVGMVSGTIPMDGIEEWSRSLTKSFPQVDQETVKELRNVFQLLDTNDCRVLLDPSIIRGLDYYDGVVFEIDAPNLGAEKQICGGGAYSLSVVFGSEVEGIGFGLGFDRILVALNNEVPVKEEGKRIYVAALDENSMKTAMEASRIARMSGATCIMETTVRPLKKVIGSALNQNCTHLMIIGMDEVERGGVSIKDLVSKEQFFLKTEELPGYLC